MNIDVNGAGPSHVTPCAPLYKTAAARTLSSVLKPERASFLETRGPSRVQPTGRQTLPVAYILAISPSQGERVQIFPCPHPASTLLFTTRIVTPAVLDSPLVMKSLRLPASSLFCFLLLLKGLEGAPPRRPEAKSPPFSSEHKEPVAGDAVPWPKDGPVPEVRAARNSEPQDEGELFQGVDPRALAAVLLQTLDRPASPPAPGGSQRGPEEEAAEALLTETVRSQTHSLQAPESQAPAAPPLPQTQENENGPDAGDPSEELEALASLLQELRDFSPSSAKRQQETAAAETETRTHTLTRVNLESPGPERVWRASWGEFQARVPESAPLLPQAPQQFQAHISESRPLPEAHQFGGKVPSPKTHLGEALAPLSKAYQGLSAPFPKVRRPESSLLSGSEAGERLLQQGLAQVEAGRRQAEATRQAAAQEERLADLASDLLLQYLLQGGARPHGLGGRGLQQEEKEQEREREEAEQERRGGEERVGEEDEEAAEAEAEAEEAERARQNALLFAEEDGEAGAEDKRSQEEMPGHHRKDAEGAEEGGEENDDDDEEMDPQTIDSLIELSTKLHLPADDVVSIIEEVEEKRKRKKNAPPEPVPPPRVAPAPTHVRSPQSPPPAPAPAPDELPDWNEVLPPWDREEVEVFPPGPYHPSPNYIRPRTLHPPAASRRRHYHHALPSSRHYPGGEAHARRAQEEAEAEERRLQEQEELENYIEHVLLQRP